MRVEDFKPLVEARAVRAETAVLSAVDNQERGPYSTVRRAWCSGSNFEGGLVGNRHSRRPNKAGYSWLLRHVQ